MLSLFQKKRTKEKRVPTIKERRKEKASPNLKLSLRLKQ